MSVFSILTAVLYSPTALLISVIIILLTVLIRHNSRKKYEYWEKKNVPIGRTQSLISNLVKRTKIEVAEQEAVNKYGKVFGTYKLGKPVIFCADPELIGNILSKDFTSFTNRREIKFNDKIMDNFLANIKDDKWKRIRSIVSPTFSSGKLRKMRPIIDDCLQSLVSDFNYLINDNKEINVKNVFGAFSMNVITRVAFGTKVDAMHDESNPIIMNAKKIFAKDVKLTDAPKFLLQFQFPRLAKLLGISIIDLSVVEYFTALTLKLIEDRKTNKTAIKRYDFLQLLLDAMENEDEEHVNESQVKKVENDELFEEQKFITHNKSMSIAEITSQCVLFFVAGYETTATAISYCAYNLACNPEMQQILYEEAKGVLESKTEVDYDLIHSLKYTDAVVSESLRMFPPAIFIERETGEDYTLRDAMKLSKGDIVHIPVYALHRNEEYFSEPEKFKPERFFIENRSHHPYAYLPFGAGPRSCVARRLALMETKLALLYTIYNFQFSATDRTEHPPKTRFNGRGTLLRDLFLKVEKRVKTID